MLRLLMGCFGNLLFHFFFSSSNDMQNCNLRWIPLCLLKSRFHHGVHIISGTMACREKVLRYITLYYICIGSNAVRIEEKVRK